MIHSNNQQQNNRNERTTMKANEVLALGESLKFSKPMQGEEDQVWTVVESRGDRVLVADADPFWDNQTIRPQTVFLKSDLERV
jgi:hypothetical protein